MKKNYIRSVVVLSALAASGAAFADDAGVTAINGLAATATSYIQAAFSVAVLIAGGFWGIRMMKKAFSKT